MKTNHLATLLQKENYKLYDARQNELGRAKPTPGVDVMITTFFNFCQLTAKSLAFFSIVKQLDSLLTK
jgi:hypothetical protein